MQKRRKKILAGFCLFLCFMWLCTLLSKSIYIHKLPMVTTVLPEEKYIAHKVEAEGIVEAGRKKAVVSISGLRVKEVGVKPGDLVEEGKLLFTVDMVGLEEIIQEKQAECDALKLQINAILENKELAAEQKRLEEERARQDYDELARYKDTLVGRATEEVAKAREALEEGMESGEEEMLQEAFQAAAYAEADAKWERDQAIKEAERGVEDSVMTDMSDATLSVYQLELSGIEDDMEKYQTLYDAEGQVVAETSGIVTDVFVEAGGRVPDTASLFLADDTVPYRFKVILSNEQKKYVSLYDEVSLKLEGSREIEATIEYLAESTSQPGFYETYIMIPEGIGRPGISGVLTHTENGEKYTYCVPPHVIHSEQNRTFVYALAEREGILGQEYYIQEVNVKILDRNENWTAIEGAIDDDSRLIETSTEELKKGAIVRWEY